MAAVIDDQREAADSGRRPLRQVVETRDGVAAAGAWKPIPFSNAQDAATVAPAIGRSRSASSTMPSYGPSRSAGRMESGRTANGARSMSGPQAAEAPSAISNSPSRRTDAARDIARANARVPLELTDPAEVVIC
jgi:hypothetical protein